MYWNEIMNDNHIGAGELDGTLDGDITEAYTIDAWRSPEFADDPNCERALTENDEDEGAVIAVVFRTLHDDVGVIYYDNIARTDEEAQVAIKEVKEILARKIQEDKDKKVHYQVVAYDKDDDTYEVLHECEDKDEAFSIASIFAPYIRKSLLLTKERQPYDWVELLEVDQNGYGKTIKCFS